MKGAFFAFVGGLAAAAAVAMLAGERVQRAARELQQVDLNKASAEDFVALGLDETMANRIVENRPYRSRIELLERYVIGQVDYNAIRDRVGIDVKHAHDAVQVAS